MRTPSLLAVLCLAIVLMAASIAQAGSMGPHPIRGWNGNQFLFEVQPQGNSTQLIAYRAIGQKWERVGSTRIHQGQSAPAGGYLQQIWFHGQPLGHLRADMSDLWYRWYPGEDRGGGQLWD